MERMPVNLLLDVGEHPVSNCYVRPGQEGPTKRLLLGQCDHCALLQLCNAFSEADLFNLIPKWVRYREPEEHLDELTSILCEYLGNDSGQLAGLTYIDKPVLDRLRQRGYATRSLDVLNGAAEGADCGIETMLHHVQQGRWTSGGTEFDLVVARHVLDHSRDLESFLAFIASCLSDEGMVLFEVPDSTVFLEATDYLLLWESHANYFTTATLERLLILNGFEVKFSRRFIAGAAAVLVAICTKSVAGKVPAHVTASDNSDARKITLFAQKFPGTRDAYAARLQEIKSDYRVVALFGAGHLGNLFVNIFGLREFFDFAVDDDPRKSGLALPGSNLLILPTDAIYEREARFILLAASLASEEGLVHRFKQKRNAVNVASIYAKSPLSVLSFGRQSLENA